MPNYDFNTDLPIAQTTEREIANIIAKTYNGKIIEYRHDNQYDIKAVINGKAFTFEVKEDFSCARTGNVGVEFECRGFASGIAVSKADFYIYKIHTYNSTKVFIFKTAAIKRMIANNEYFRIVSGGDVGSNSMNYLFKYNVFTSHGKQIA